MTYRVSVAVQTHPLRDHLSLPLAATLGAERVVDPDPHHIRSPWRTYRHALETTPVWATHRLIVQDDVVPCDGFLDAVAAAVAARPGRLLSFFVGGHPVENARALFDACGRGEAWAELGNRRWCPVLALVWPVEFVEPLLGYVDAQRWPPTFRSDDEIVGRWLRHAGKLALASVPSLVEHPDVEPSLLGKRALAGRDPGRCAACFIHPDYDARRIDWTRGPGDDRGADPLRRDEPDRSHRLD